MIANHPSSAEASATTPQPAHRTKKQKSSAGHRSAIEVTPTSPALVDDVPMVPSPISAPITTEASTPEIRGSKAPVSILRRQRGTYTDLFICKSASDVMLRWKSKFPALLDALVAHEALPEPELSSPPPPTLPLVPCPTSHRLGTSARIYRCLDCSLPLACGACIVEQHRHNPLHRAQQWVETHFVRSSLHDIEGMKIHLGHGGQPCHNWSDGYSIESTLIVVHTNGLHRVSVRWCSCLERANNRMGQLIDQGLFPGSPDEFHLRSAFTIDALWAFHLHSTESNTAGKDFVDTLVRMTNNTFPDEVKVSWSSLYLFLVLTSSNRTATTNL